MVKMDDVQKGPGRLIVLWPVGAVDEAQQSTYTNMVGFIKIKSLCKTLCPRKSIVTLIVVTLLTAMTVRYK